ncbi:hypothetical protein BOX15_Mlig000987g1, partial [Macrostomum lignano]
PFYPQSLGFNLMTMKKSNKFPEKNTEEEEMLLQNYALLKQLRKQLTELRSRQAAEAETNREKEETPVKPNEDARVAAERLVKLGKIKIQSACPPRVLMKKGRDSTGPVSAYRPYSPTGGGSDEIQQHQNQLQQPPAKRPRSNLYDSFVSGGVQDPAPATPSGNSAEPNKPRGNTLFVQGYNIHPDMLRSAFSPFGPISRIAMENRAGGLAGRFGDFKANNKPKAFVTFESEDDAANAMDQLDGQLVKGSVLSVRLARKQPSAGGQGFRGYGGRPMPPQLPGISDWTSDSGGGGGRYRLGLGFASPDAPDAAGASSPRYAPPDTPTTAGGAELGEASNLTPGARSTEGPSSIGEDSDSLRDQQRRPLQYSDGVFVSSDPMEEDAVVELDEVM